MGRIFPEIDDKLAAWIRRQHVVFVATAPTSTDGHVNVSPKGVTQTFVILGPLQVAYVDLFGSGIETVAHLKENGRIVLMFCAFEGPPKTLRLHGRGTVVEQSDVGYAELRDAFDLPAEVEPTIRSIVHVEVTRVADSCGFTVPLMTFEGERQQLFDTARSWIDKNGPDAVRDYCDENNARSIDGLEGLEAFTDETSTRVRTTHSHEGRAL